MLLFYKSTLHKEHEIQYRMSIQKYSTYCMRRKLVQLVALNSLKLSEREVVETSVYSLIGKNTGSHWSSLITYLLCGNNSQIVSLLSQQVEDE
jgi:hypothetical protein